MRAMFSVEQITKMILAGERMLLAGDEDLLRQLPRGQWVGGTIPYFIGEKGAVMTREKLFGATLPPDVTACETKLYDEKSLPEIVTDEPCHGFSFLIIPGLSAIHQAFAENVQNYPGIFDRPLVGWVAGVAPDQIGTRKAKVVNGLTGEFSEDRAICLHATLRSDIEAEIGIINPFTQGDGDVITVDRPGFRVSEARINGKPANLADYFAARELDGRMPLVANYSGAMVNVSVKSVGMIERCVEFYAPLFPNIEYRLAVPVDDYEAAFAKEIKAICPEPMVFMNCILNYIYGDEDGMRTGHLTGPITFGEIAYGLLNQTIVYMVLRKI